MTTPVDLEIREQVVFATVGDRELHLNLAWPKGLPALPMPVVAVVHGGGWCGGDHNTEDHYAYARRGYFAANVEYRLSQEAIFPAQNHDCKAAIRYLRAHAAEYRLNPDKIGIVGSSAGGHLVALMGTAGHVAALEGDLGNAEQASAVQAVVDFCGPTDLTTTPQSGTEFVPLREVVDQLLGGPLAEKLDLARAASPLMHVNPQNPPFLIFHGDMDDVVPLSQSEVLHQALLAAGVDSTFVTVKGGGHGFGPEAIPSPEDIAEMIFEFFDKHLR